MIDLRSGQFTDIFPVTSDPQIYALSYALKQQTGKLLDAADEAKVAGDISKLPDEVLDLLAIEFRTMYYDESYDRETREELVKNALKWHCTAGTKAAVEELVQTVFGEGKIIEWFEFTDTDDPVPGEFDITTRAEFTPQALEEFKRIISRVKNVSSHLRRLYTSREVDMDRYSGVNAHNILIMPPIYCVSYISGTTEGRHKAGASAAPAYIIQQEINFST